MGSLTRDGLNLQLVAVDNAGNVIPLAGDANGNLLLGNAGALIGAVHVQDTGTGLQLGIVGSPTGGDAIGVNGFNGISANAASLVFNSSTWDRARSASAANLAAQSGLGAALVAPPGIWTVVSGPAGGSVASAVKSAAAGGVRHIAWLGVATWVGDAIAPTATGASVNLRDGGSSGGSVLVNWQVGLQAVAGQDNAPAQLTAMSPPGTAATAMTLEYTTNNGGANSSQGVTLGGFDAS